MKYPYVLYRSGIRLLPIFEMTGDPFVLDLSNGSRLLKEIDAGDPVALHEALQQQMRPGHNWGLGGYLERRDKLLQRYPQMVAEKRFYHLGLDIAIPAGTAIHAPLDAKVVEVGYEKGEGNYGGYVLLSHAIARCEPFFSLFGHLAISSLPEKDTTLAAGESVARIGDFHENGNWYHHTHLQVITELGLREGYLHKGYAGETDLPRVRELCPDPLPLLTARM